MRRFCLLALLALFVPFRAEAQSATSKKTQTPVPSNVARPAPEFVWSSVSGKVRRLRDLRGQPVVLLFATNPEQKDFKRQVKQITRRFKVLAARNVLFFVAFTKETGVIGRSDVPFVVLPDPLSVADSYRVGDFGIAIIGTDGNLDYATDRVITGQRIVDVVNNSYAAQAQERRD
jgi:AhpC/TSA family